MEQVNSLFHNQDSNRRYAELCGSKHSVQTTNPVELVQFFLTQFENSEQHCQIQENEQHIYVAISSSRNYYKYYVVRLSEFSAVTTTSERAACAKLGIRLEVASKPACPVVYRAF